MFHHVQHEKDPNKPSKLTIYTENAGSTSKHFVLPFNNNGDVDVDITWGDGTIQNVRAYDSVDLIHEYSSGGTYQITIEGKNGGFSFKNVGDRLKVTSLDAWGTNELKYMVGAFQGCANMRGFYTDTPTMVQGCNWQSGMRGLTLFNGTISDWDWSRIGRIDYWMLQNTSFNQPLTGVDLSNITYLLNAWNGCTSLDQPIDHLVFQTNANLSGLFAVTAMNHGCTGWDTSTNNIAGVFSGCPEFNQPIQHLNISSTASFAGMFDGCTKFNQPLTEWGMTAATSTYRMFKYARAFNQDISHFDMSGVESMYEMFTGATSFNNGGATGIGDWDTSAVESMYAMFQLASSFNQPLNGWNTSANVSLGNIFNGASAFNNGGITGIGDWDTGLVTHMGNAFTNAAAFDQDLGNWNIESVTNIAGFLAGTTISTAYYDSMLINWSGQTAGATGLSFSAGSATYTAGGTAETAHDYFTDTLEWSIADGGTA